jgi:hypothetical protein
MCFGLAWCIQFSSSKDQYFFHSLIFVNSLFSYNLY